MTLSEVLALRTALTEKKTEAIRHFRTYLRPEVLLSKLAQNVDLALRALIQTHPLPAGAVMAAVGGYGRGELYPHSDVDVLILLPQPPNPSEITAIETLIAAIWDLGVEPSHSVRTINDCQTLAANDITVETSLQESRWLAGDQNLLSELHTVMRRQLDPQRYFLAKRAEMQQRHARQQDTPYALEPNCKESPGGLRDVQVLLWLAHAAGVGSSWSDIAASDLISSTEFRALRRAELAFKRLRIELHLACGRREDRVLFDLQPALAATYGFQASRNRIPSELLMQQYYWAARVVSQMNIIMMQSIEERLFPASIENIHNVDENFRLRNGRLEIRREDGFARNPALLFKVFLIDFSGKTPPELSASTLRAMWNARRRIDTQFRRNPVNRHNFIQILQLGDGLMPALRRLTMLNIFPRYLPVFRRIVGQMQHDLFHAYTVDQHILMVINNLYQQTQPSSAAEFPLAHHIASHFQDYWLLYIAALFHDIAKGRGGSHSELGAADARRFCQQHGLEESATDLIEFLVRQHLTMSLVAQKRDLSDPRVIHEFARCVKDKRHLDALYALTVADIRGTGPKVWNSWKGKLLEDLHQRTLLALTQTQPDSGAALKQRKQAAAELIRLSGLRDESRDTLWQHLDADYFMRHDAADIAWHTRHLYHRTTSAEPLVKARVIGKNEALQVMVYAPDADDLFVRICRYFDHHALSVQDARIYTTQHGWALDNFIVLLPQHEKDYRSYASLVEHGLDQQLKLSPACGTEHISQPDARGIRSRRSRAFPLLPEVQLERSTADSTAWKLSISAADRPGLLHSLAKVFVAHHVNLKTAKILTLGDRVEDLFILTGQSLEEDNVRLQLELSVLDTLSSPSS